MPAKKKKGSKNDSAKAVKVDKAADNAALKKAEAERRRKFEEERIAEEKRLKKEDERLKLEEEEHLI